MHSVIILPLRKSLNPSCPADLYIMWMRTSPWKTQKAEFNQVHQWDRSQPNVWYADGSHAAVFKLKCPKMRLHAVCWILSHLYWWPICWLGGLSVLLILHLAHKAIFISVKLWCLPKYFAALYLNVNSRPTCMFCNLRFRDLKVKKQAAGTRYLHRIIEMIHLGLQYILNILIDFWTIRDFYSSCLIIWSTFNLLYV